MTVWRDDLGSAVELAAPARRVVSLVPSLTEAVARSAPGDPMAFNDHTDWRWDERVLRTLTSLDSSFGRLCGRLARELERFEGYASRYSAALTRARAGQNAWVDGHDRDSCHIVWIQFHEDLLATLGIARGADS